VSRGKAIGLTALLVEKCDTEDSVNSDLKVLMGLTPAGRHCAVIYDLPGSTDPSNPDLWSQKSTCYEGLLVEGFLGLPPERESNNEWEFFANLAIRLCTPKKGKRQVAGEIGVLIFRKLGPKSYKRRLEVSRDFQESAKIDALHPVFTRDVANNIWHMRNHRSRDQIVDRLGTLLAWPDERIIISEASSLRTKARKVSKYEKDLIGVPSKEMYEWA
jgi:hypothetical protein